MEMLVGAHMQNQVIFLTGATGFLGLALVSKIIYYAPSSRLLLLVRGGQSRWIDVLRQHLPPTCYKSIIESETIEILDGDIEKSGLGLSERDLLTVTSTTTIYIHAASSTNLRLSLPAIAASVVEPSLKVADMAIASPKTEQFVYLSTAYANAHLHHLHEGIDTVVKETIYPLRPSAMDSTSLEYADLCAASTPPEFLFHKFPFPYTYAKHLTERLLEAKFRQNQSSASLLIIRPSIIGPALKEPYPCYELPGSAPGTTFAAALVSSFSWRMTFVSRFPDPYNQSNVDEVPVDIVVNHLLLHISRRTEGIVHAVAGKDARRSFRNGWEGAMAERRLPWTPKLIWRSDLDWRDRRLHGLARLFVIFGTSYIFDTQRRTQLWEVMTQEERRAFPLSVQQADIGDRRPLSKPAVASLLRQYLCKKQYPKFLLRLLIRGPIAQHSERHLEPQIDLRDGKEPRVVVTAVLNNSSVLR